MSGGFQVIMAKVMIVRSCPADGVVRSSRLGTREGQFWKEVLLVTAICCFEALALI